jgi:hypothetical protein
MKITFLQSTDPAIYAAFLDVTSVTIKEYCARHGTSYHSYMGLIRGTHPWQAALNRIPILKSYVLAGYEGWIIYVDADAYIADLDFDLAGYLAGKSDYAIIAAPSGVTPPRWWDVNNGVFALNCGHPHGRALVDRWHERLMMNSDEALAGEAKWGDVVDDQHIFHESLLDIAGMEQFLYRDEGPDPVFNWEHRFIRQRVRLTGTLASRLSGLAEVVDEVMQLSSETGRADAFEARAQHDANTAFVNAIYTVIFGRDADQAGFDGVMRALKRGDRTYAQELDACLASPEFEANVHRFLSSRFPPESVTAIAHRLLQR